MTILRDQLITAIKLSIRLNINKGSNNLTIFILSMPQTRSKNHLPKENLYFSDDQASATDHKSPKKDDKPLLAIHQNSNQFPSQSGPQSPFLQLKIQSRPSENLEERQIKEENSSFLSSLMDLEDIISDPQQEFNPQIMFGTDEYDPIHHKKSKKIKKDHQFSGLTPSIPVKIQDNESSSYNGEKKDRQRGNRKIRTTINEQKIKIMEYLFPFVAKQEPYKGTVLSLKDVGKIVDLGYSTILHKYRDYREKGQIEKGLLLKCKNFKRKYNKSLILENFIKRALKESQFKTAKQLANFISEKYHINANRSIVSRHLNEMHREKAKIEDRLVKVPGLSKQFFVDGQTFKKLKQFCLVYLGLKNQKVRFQYLTVIRIYLVENRIFMTLERKVKKFGIIDLIISATESGIKEYYMNFVDETDVVLGKNSSDYDSLAYKALYNQLEIDIQNHQLDITFENEDKAFIVYPFKNGKYQSDYRFKVLENLMDKKINILTVPPHLNVRHLNFIKQWFQHDVFLSVNKFEFGNFAEWKENIIAQINNKQDSLNSYANVMQTSIKNF